MYTVLVTAAHGNQGRLLIPKLARAGHRIRAWARSEASIPALKQLGAAETVAADLLDQGAIDQAIRGIDIVYHVGPNAHPQEDSIGLRMIAAARSAGVRHFILSSVLHPLITALVQHVRKLRIEEALVSSGLAYSILQPAHFMQTLQHRAAFADHIFRLTWSLERRQSLVDLDDVTDVAAAIISSPDPHSGATYELSSSDCLTAFEIARIIGDVTGRDVGTREVRPAEVIEAVFGRGMDEAQFRRRVALFERVARWYSDHDFVGNSTVARMLLGRAPTSLRTFVEREYGRWSAGASAA